MIMRKVVVLPEPLGPMKPWREPSGTVSSSFSTATKFLTLLVTFRSAIAAVIMGSDG